MATAIERYKFVLSHFNSLPPDIQKYMTSEKMSDELLRCICEICFNILKRNVPVSEDQFKDLSHYKSIIKLLSKQSVHKRCKRKKLKLIGRGFLPLLFSIITPLISSMVGSLT